MPTDDEIRLSPLWFLVHGGPLGAGRAGNYVGRGHLDQSLVRAVAGISGVSLLAPFGSHRRIGDQPYAPDRPD
jgi:hypothetical protein